jgi:hypothetical protein
MPGSKAEKKKSSGAAGNGDRFTGSARARGLSTISKAKAERSIAYAKRSAKRLETLRRKSALEEVAGLRGGGGSGIRPDEEDEIEDASATHTHGNGTLLITFTTNQHWQEIQENLIEGQSAYDRPDIVCRVFDAKLHELLHDLREGTVYKKKDGSPWRCKYIMYTVEFQKRGLPNAYIVVRLEGMKEDMPKKGEDVDRLISARLPEVLCRNGLECNSEEHRLLAAVKKHMLHTCAKGVCMPLKGLCVCIRRFPKPVRESTTQDDRGYPVYARGERDVNVVPYTPAFLLKYDCHINVELAGTSWIIKYMVSDASYVSPLRPHCGYLASHVTNHLTSPLPLPPSPLHAAQVHT